MKTLNEVWRDHNAQFERALAALYADPDEPQRRLFESMSYSLNAGGKRLRPFLAAQFCAACGGDPDTARPAQLAIEMIHTYSLIHDDLPAMDNDDYRRGKPTNHRVYGEALAILAGDGLLTDAFRVLSESALPADRALACVRILSANAGPWGMAGGQVLDMEAEERECTETEVRAIQSRKTGCLIRAACQMGVVCAGGSKAQLEAAGVYADHLGLAFQIRDDVLDVVGDAGKLGKSVGTDAEKNTFVKLYGLERCRRMIEDETALAVAALEPFQNAALLSELADRMATREF